MRRKIKTTHTKVLTVGQDLVVQGEIVGGDNVDASILLDLPVGEPQPLGLGEELILGDLAAPVCIVTWLVLCSFCIMLTKFAMQLQDKLTHKLRWPSSGHG